MKAAYCEIKRGRNCVTVNYYSKEGYGLELGCRKLERERREAYAAKRRRLNRIRENIGAGVGMLGFLLLLCCLLYTSRRGRDLPRHPLVQISQQDTV